MSKINKLEQYLMEKAWVHKVVTRLKDYFTGLLETVERLYLQRSIDKMVADLDASDAAKVMIKALADNTLSYIFADRAMNHNKNGISASTLIAIVMRIAHRFYETAGAVVGIQPITTPVGIIRTLVYRQLDADKNPVSDLSQPIEALGKMTLELVTNPVEAVTRKLLTRWSFEAASDFKALHGLDIELEIARAVSDEIVDELISELFNDIINNAPTEDATECGFSNEEMSFAEASLLSSTISVRINSACNEIARMTRRGAGNVIIVSPLLVAVLQSSELKSVFAPSQNSFKGPYSMLFVGTLNGTIKVYCSVLPFFKDNIIVAYKGVGEVDAGMVVAPYQPLLLTGPMVEANTFQPVMSCLTRYGKHMNSINYYRVLKI